MPKLLRVIFIFGLIFALGMLGLCMIGYRMVTGSLPRTQGDINIDGLHEQVRVFRDGFHIPHIIAENEHDLFFAQGFVTAQDRLWQIDLWKRAAAGRLSEVFGSTTLKSDSLMRIVGIRRTAERILPYLSSESRRTFQAYCEGMNALIAHHGNRLPVEFTLLDYKPEPWNITDCIALSRWFAWNSSTAWNVDAAYIAIVSRLGSDKAQSLFPGYIPTSTESPRFRHSFADNLFGMKSSARGSNAWVISGNRSVTGKPLLANDPHLALTNPPILYETHLVGGGFDVTGLAIPGLPGIVIGHNQHIAWGIANLMADDLDLYGETKFSGSHSSSFRAVLEEIEVRGDSTVVVEVRETDYGPIVTEILTPESTIQGDIVAHWTGHDISDEALAYYHLNKADNWEAFRSALQHYKINPQVFLYADTDGNIGLQAAGHLPFTDYPTVYNPTEGYLVAANHRLSTRMPALPSNLWALSSRTERIHTLLNGKEKHSLMDMKRIQADVVSLYARNFIAAVKPILEGHTFEDPIEKLISKKLLSWQGEMKAGSAEALLFETFLQNLLSMTFKEDLGKKLFTDYLKLHTMPLAALQRFLHGIDFLGRSPSEQEAIIVTSFQDAVASLAESHGNEPTKWSWGGSHTLTFRHPLGTQPLLRATFNLGPFAVNGSGTTVNCLGYMLDQPFDVTWGPGARMIVDLDKFDNSISVLPTGQSGQPMDEHYRDQTQLYTGNLYHPNLSDTAKIINSGWDLLTLKPGESHE